MQMARAILCYNLHLQKYPETLKAVVKYLIISLVSLDIDSYLDSSWKWNVLIPQKPLELHLR